MRSAQRVHTRLKGGPKPQSKGCASRDEDDEDEDEDKDEDEELVEGSRGQAREALPKPGRQFLLFSLFPSFAYTRDTVHLCVLLAGVSVRGGS